MNVSQEIRERIFSAANALIAQGIESPTNTQVRDHLGGGSLSHISPVMREWRDSRKSVIAAALEMPADLRRVVEVSLAQVWASATKIASAASEQYREEAEQAMSEVLAERDEALNEVLQLESRLKELNVAVEEKDASAAKLEFVIKDLQEKIAKKASDIEVISARMSERNIQLDDLKNRLASAELECRDLQKSIAVIASDRDVAKRELSISESRNVELTAEVNRSASLLKEQADSLEKLTSEASKMVAEVGALRGRIEERDDQILDLKADLRAVQEKYQELQGHLVEIARGKNP